jgi:hypothetical protein
MKNFQKWQELIFFIKILFMAQGKKEVDNWEEKEEV